MRRKLELGLGLGWFAVAGLIAAAALVSGCGDSGEDETIALFEVPRAGAASSGFYALPYPNDIRVDDTTGAIDFSDHIRPNVIIGEYLDAVRDHQRGFSVNAATFMRFSDRIDPTSLPTTEASTTDAAAVYLVNVDPDSARRGERIPLRFRFEHYEGEVIGTDWMSALPFPGFRLDQQTTYALVVTNRVRAEDGSPVAAAPDFLAITSADTPSDADLARAKTLYAPLLSWLDEPGADERADVVSAGVFTTQDATSLMGKIREVIWDTVDQPTPRDMVYVRDESGFALYDGVYDSPNFQTGEVPYKKAEDGGAIVLDTDGKPIVQRTEALRFSVSIPLGTVPASGWPIVLYAHGTGGSYRTFRNNGTARRLAAEGIACIGIDQVLHGPRNPGATPEISFFNFQNPLAARHNTLQGALDNFQLVRLVRGFDYTDSANSRTVKFDASKLYFFGHSQGGLTGPPFLAYEPEVTGAVLSGAGGLLYLSMILKTEPVDIVGLVGAFIRDKPLDEFNPVLAILQGYVDLSDAVSYAPLLVRRPAAGVGAKHIFQSEGFTDRFTPPPSIEALATSIGVDLVNPVLAPVKGIELRGRTSLTTPVTANLEGKTAVLVQYDEVAGSDGHFVLFDVPAAQVQSIQFLSTLASSGTPTVVAAP